MTDALEDHEGTVSIVGRTTTNLRFADGIDGSAGEEEELANLVEDGLFVPNIHCQYGLESVSCFLTCSFDMLKYTFLVSLCRCRYAVFGQCTK